MLIAIEGGDGCGKTTVAQALAKALGGECLHFPTDDAVTGPMIRAYLAREWGVEQYSDGGPSHHDRHASALAFQALQVTNRMEAMPRLFEATYDGPNLVLARYWQSAWVYGQLDGLDAGFLLRCHESMAVPDLNILLDIDAATAAERRATRGDVKPERYEEKIEFQDKVNALYRQLWEEKPVDGEVTDCEWHVVDARQPLVDVFAEAMGLVYRKMEEKHG